MKKAIGLAAISAVLSFVGIQAASASQMFTTGTGNWINDGTTTDWGTSTGTDSGTPWTNGNDAVFEGTSSAFTMTGTGATAVTANSLTFNTTGGTTIGGVAANPLTMSGTSVNVTTGTATISAVIAGTAGLVKTGIGSLTLSGNNTYSNGTTVSQGTLFITGQGNVGTGTTITLGDLNTGSNNVTMTVNNNGFSTATPNLTVPNLGTGNTITINIGPQNDDVDATITLNRSTTIASNAASGGAYLNATSGVVTGNLNGGTLTLECSGAGALYIGNSGGANTFVGTVALDKGLVTLQGSVNAGVLGTTNPVVMSLTGALNLGGHALTIAELTGAATNTIALGGGTLTISSGNSAVFQGGISGGGGVTKSGAGVETFSGTNGYTGTTTITNGTLKMGVAGALPTGSALVMSGGTFNTNGISQTTSGTLTVTGAASIDFGAGNTNTILHFGDSHAVSWTGGTLTISDWTGSLSGGGNDQFYVGANSSGLSAAQLAQIDFTGHPNGAQYVGTSGEIVPLPEPSVVGLISLTGLGLLARRRRTA